MNQKKTYSSLIVVTIFIIGAFITAFLGRKTQAPATVADTSTLNTDSTPTIITPIPSKPTSTDGDDDSTSDNDSDNTSTQTSTPIPVAVPKKTTVASNYKNGTYTATGSYDSPAGMESINVSITLNNGIVTASSVTNMAGDRTSSRYQTRFIGGYQPYVVGKSIDSIKLGVISGSSLTPIGFNNALATIKAKAKA